MGRIEVEQEQLADARVPRDARGFVPGAVAPSPMGGVFFVVVLRVVNQYIGPRRIVAQYAVELEIAMFQIRRVNNALAVGLNAVSVCSLGMIERERLDRDLADLDTFGF